MSIPFFSIDFKLQDWRNYFFGSMGINYQGLFLNEISKRFNNNNIYTFPSSRISFFLLIKSLFKPNDEIIFSAMSFPLYIKICCELNLVPVLVDIETDHMTINPELIKKNITKKTKAIVVTNLFGHPAYLDEISKIAKEYNLLLIEDCAQSIDSFYNKKETGSFGDVALYSTGAVKTPTTLGGGILICKNKKVSNNIKDIKSTIKFNKNFSNIFPYYIKNLISILNSYPSIYSLLSHKAIGVLKKNNPELMRKIFYSGIGDNKSYNPLERPNQINYQFSVGVGQFDKIRDMTLIRRKNSLLLNDIFFSNKKINFLKEGINSFWNCQYYILYSKNNADYLYDEMFKKGTHLLYENVWDCTNYNLKIKSYTPLVNVKKICKHLIRIPNNSMLNDKQIIKIGSEINNLLK